MCLIYRVNSKIVTEYQKQRNVLLHCAMQDVSDNMMLL
jgi:hypothetical protein